MLELIIILMFAAYVTVMKLKDKAESMEEGWQKKAVLVFGYSIAVPGYLFDLWFNFFIGSLLFWRKPDRWIQTFTSRLEIIIKHEPKDTWRFKLAFMICKYMLHPFDQGHCGKLPE